MNVTAVILAAGQSTRMKSSLSKVLHPLAGKPLIRYSLDAVRGLGAERPVVIVGREADALRNAVGDAANFAVQERQLGTANAVQAAEETLRGKTDLVVVLSADMPLLKPETIQRLVETQKANPGPMTLTTVVLEQSHGFGRILRRADGSVQEIVEEAHCTPEQRAIRELNAGIYCFQAAWLWDALKRVPLSPKGEYYLTDLVAVAVSEGKAVQAVELDEPEEAIGINNRVHLAEAEGVMRRRINEKLMLSGVTILNPEVTYIEAGVEIGRDTVILPNTYLRGKTVIGENCKIGPNTMIDDSQIGNQCTVFSSVIDAGAVMEDHSEIGPFGHLRKGAHLGQGVHMGNFGEVKNSYLGPGTKMGHFSYIGDATIGEDVNIGAGTITCNYDGVHKNKTKIGDHVFVGSDTMLVAPLEIGEGAKTGAGSVVNRDVPAGEVVVGVPARPLRKEKKVD